MPTVLITGAARGLGLDFTKQYAAKGWKVLACARKADALKDIKGDVHHHALEVTDYKAVKALAAKLKPFLDGTRLRVDDDLRDSKNNTIEGLYDHNTNTITIHSKAITEETLMHELTHAAT